MIEFLLSTGVPCYVTFYWNIRKDAIDAVLCKSDAKEQRSIFDESQDRDSDSDLEQVAPSMSALPLEHFLQGSYKERSSSELYP